MSMRSGPRILVVDDDRDYGELVAELLEMRGYPADATFDVEAAGTRLKAGRYDAVVTDLHMGPMNGMDLLAIVRERHPDTPVIVMSAFPTADTRADVMAAGACAFIDKPFGANDLIGVLTQVGKGASDTSSAS